MTSLSSSSSEEKEASGVMNLSAMGVLPDLRSPDSIQNDIEYKEKILADVLNFDGITIGNGDKIDEVMNGRPKDGFDQESKDENDGSFVREFCVKPILFPKLSSSRIFPDQEFAEEESDDVHILKDAPG